MSDTDDDNTVEIVDNESTIPDVTDADLADDDKVDVPAPTLSVEEEADSVAQDDASTDPDKMGVGESGNED